MYRELGLEARATEVFLEVAIATREPETLAQTAVRLFDTGAVEQGMRVAERVAVAKVKDGTAYALLMKHGEALLQLDPKRGLEKMEAAYASYPQERTAEGDELLLKAYLVTGRSAAARALVMDLDAHVQQNKVDAPRLQRAAVLFGNYLYEQEDYRAAADAYALAVRDATDRKPDVLWAMYQQANSLLGAGDFAEATVLYDQVKASNTPWAGDATMKADYARVEQRLRGGPPAG
jgi:tetratricopeptide (TPR) repeat protein